MKWNVGAKIGAGFLLAMMLLLGLGLITYRNTVALANSSEQRRQNFLALQSSAQLLSLLKDGETGPRGYLLTGQDRYLEPYEAGAEKIRYELEPLRKLAADNATPEQLTVLRQNVDAKLVELSETIGLRREQGFEPALQVVLTDKGKQSMDTIRKTLSDIESQVTAQLEASSRRVASDSRASFLTIEYGLAAASIAFAVIGVTTARNIARPLREITEVADR